MSNSLPYWNLFTLIREALKKKSWKFPIRRWPHLIGKKYFKKKRKMIYAPRNEFCMIWVIFWMPTDQVMAFLCFISNNQSVDISGQGWGGGRGGHNWKKQVCLKMLFRQFQVFLAHVFFFVFSYWKIDPHWAPPLLLEFSNNFFFWNLPLCIIIFFSNISSPSPETSSSSRIGFFSW